MSSVYAAPENRLRASDQSAFILFGSGAAIAAKLSLGLLARGVQKGDVIAIHAERSPEAVAAHVLRVGGVICPLVPESIRFNAGEIITRANAGLLLADDLHDERTDSALQVVRISQLREMQVAETSLFPAVSHDDPALVLLDIDSSGKVGAHQYTHEEILHWAQRSARASKKSLGGAGSAISET